MGGSGSVGSGPLEYGSVGSSSVSLTGGETDSRRREIVPVKKYGWSEKGEIEKERERRWEGK
jgi:hypothetical protein